MDRSKGLRRYSYDTEETSFDIHSEGVGDFVIRSEWYNSKEQAASNAYGIYKALHDSCRI